ncbi:OefC protein [Cordyceps fumosorosea ARSEF 2679]|uniref:OefC protein n=1 Tax=Cordyceps fumosorosea (strain ARSEF 2679) TaxID=1081104 RepID=A0A162JAE0_CORFA|nr:OefC protein [Cordyceps fumosorosea ARSEF 2679]OAA66042.1 OefC protein [Cordyceps fumosorosea ARSEF 2679]
MDRMFGEPDIDNNQPQQQERNLHSESMAHPKPNPRDNPWTPPAVSNSSPGSEISPLSGLVPNGTNVARSSYSTASSCEESWAGSSADHDEVDRELNWDEWDQGSVSALIIPKNEPADEDDVAMSEFKAVTLAPESGTVVPVQKRGRGRPRKNPIPAPTNGIKVTKGRTKTGCITCRRRKKKCDEAKPACMNCEKNSVFCEGYNEKQIWRSGKERAEEGRANRETLPLLTLPALIQGLDTPEDRLFLDHYITRLSTVLTVEPESQNAFKSILLNLAIREKGLLHSILSISSIHIDLETPYGEALLKRNPAISRKSLQARSEHHTTEAQNYGLPTPAPTHGTSSSRPPSPPPSRRPSQDDKRVTTSISDALHILESFGPTDQCQTLLLIPCLLIGTACFDPALRPRIRAAVQTVREYTGLRNADRVQEVLNETWALMDVGDWAAVWDWQSVARRKGLDFLCS